MNQYNNLNIKLPSSQINRIKPRTSSLSSNVIGDTNDESHFPQKSFMN